MLIARRSALPCVWETCGASRCVVHSCQSIEVVRVGVQAGPAGGKWTRDGCLPGLGIVQCTLGQPFRLTGCKYRHMSCRDVTKHRPAGYALERLTHCARNSHVLLLQTGRELPSRGSRASRLQRGRVCSNIYTSRAPAWVAALNLSWHSQGPPLSLQVAGRGQTWL